MKIKRILAYIIDFVIVSFIASLLFLTPPFEKSYKNYENHFQIYENKMSELFHNASEENIEKDLLHLQYDVNKNSSTLLILNIGTLFVYFGIVSFLFKGKTIGKKLMKLQVVSVKGERLNPFLYIVRSIIITNLIPEVIRLIILITCSEDLWIKTSTPIGFLSYFIYFILILTMILREDERSLHDLLCNTKVISTKAKKE